MSSVNSVTLLGNVGKDPEVRTMQNGNQVASFSMATTDTWKDKASGERKSQSQWHNVVVFNKGLVSVIDRYVNKGSKLYICGKLKTRSYEDNQGTKKYVTEVVLENFGGELVLLDSKPSSPHGGNGQDIEDEIPF